MLQFHVGGWNHRAVWGEEGAIPFGKVRTPEKVLVGALPKAGEWVKLEVAAERLGLKPGMKVTGYAFTQFGGTVYWDRLSISSRVDPAKDPQWSWKVWMEKNQGKRVAGLPNDLQTLVRGKKPAEWPADRARSACRTGGSRTNTRARASIVEGARGEKLALESKKKALEDTIPATFIMADLPEPRESFVMLRGQYDKPGEKVARGTPARFFRRCRTRRTARPASISRSGSSSPGAPADRARDGEPLLAAVLRHRAGEDQSSDFGSQGEPPSHPELLDWLAVDVPRDRLGREGARAAASSLARPSARARKVDARRCSRRDPENRLLARGPRFRLDAEQLRDNALFVTGLLNPTDRRQRRDALPAAEHLGAGRLRRQQHAQLHAGHRRARSTAAASTPSSSAPPRRRS